MNPMNEFCAVGLHSFTDWRDTGGERVQKGVQTRSCRHCRVVEERPWRAPERRPLPVYDPYADH